MAEHQARFGESYADFDIRMFKSWDSFTSLFEDAVRLDCVTYCDSPDLLLDLLDEYELEELEVVVGDADDYREELVGAPEVASRLEELKEAGVLRIFTCPTKDVHSKIYEITHEDGSLTLLVGSQNLTRTGWGRQTNCAVVVETRPDSDVHREFREVYEDHRDYGQLFLDDLTEEIEASDDDRADIIERWVEGRVSTRDELEEFRGELSDKVLAEAPDPEEATIPPSPEADGGRAGTETVAPSDGPEDSFIWGDEEVTVDEGQRKGGPEREIVQSLKNYSDSFRDNVGEQFKNYGRVTEDRLRISPVAFAEQTETAYGLPIMRVKEDQRSVYLLTQNRRGYFGAELPDPGDVDEALAHLESYFATIERHANSRDTQAFQTHVFEALLYFFWAPFINRHAEVFRDGGVRNLDKQLPFLYIHGESDSGKGTFARFALHLLSGGQVSTPLDADQFGVRLVRHVRSLKTSFPLVVDDVQKATINRTDALRNFWSGWSPERKYPGLVFISNDTKPDEWFRNRAKVLHFDGRFTSGIQGEMEVNEIIDEGSPLFHWFTHLYLGRTIEPQDDVLADAREVFEELYERADRPLPAYFPDEPAEKKYDIGRRVWYRAYEDGKFSIEEDRDVLRVTFTDDMEGWEVARMLHDLPSLGTQRFGRELVIEDSERFLNWLLDNDEADKFGNRRGIVNKLKSVFGS